MGWYVVKFEDEETVEAVPKIWYSEDTKECKWPPTYWNSKKINDFIKFRKAPQYDWNSHRVVILGTYGKICVLYNIFFIYITKYMSILLIEIKLINEELRDHFTTKTMSK